MAYPALILHRNVFSFNGKKQQHFFQEPFHPCEQAMVGLVEFSSMEQVQTMTVGCWEVGCKVTLCRSFPAYAPLLCVWSVTCTGRIKACRLNSNIRVGFLQNYGIFLLEKKQIDVSGWKALAHCHYKTCGPNQVAFRFFSIVGNKETSLCLNLLHRF